MKRKLYVILWRVLPLLTSLITSYIFIDVRVINNILDLLIEFTSLFQDHLNELKCWLNDSNNLSINENKDNLLPNKEQDLSINKDSISTDKQDLSELYFFILISGIILSVWYFNDIPTYVDVGVQTEVVQTNLVHKNLIDLLNNMRINFNRNDQILDEMNNILNLMDTFY